MDAWEAIDQLAAGTIRDNSPAARQLVDLATPVLQGRARRRALLHGLFRSALREEAAQEALLRVWKYRQTYRGSTTKAFNAWYRRICGSAAYNVLRSAEHRKEEPMGDLQHAAINCTHPSESVSTALHRELMAALKSCIDALRIQNEKAYDVASLIFFTGATEREAAAVLGLPKATAHERKTQALTALAECLTRRGVT